MAFTKYASLEVSKVLEIKGSAERDASASLAKIAAFEDYRTEDGYLYARIRAISSRVNKNHDGWPSVELAGGQDVFDRHTSSTGGFTVNANANDQYGFSTFIGKPIFVDHHNSDPSRARGVIVDAKLHVDDHKTAAQKDSYYRDAPSNHTPPTWVELLLEVDAKSFPKLAKAIIDGSKNAKNGIDGFSMGCFVPGTPITLADGTQKPIEAIEVGDEVLTHTGKTEPVTFTMVKPHSGLIYNVKTFGQASPMRLTEEHPVWTKNGWVEAKDLVVGDHVLTPAMEGVGHPGNWAFARLLGYYLAEGNLGYDKKRFPDGRPVSVEWNFHVDEIEYVEEVRAALNELGYNMAGPYVKNSCASIRCNSSELAARFFEYGGKHSWGKKLHSEVLRWDTDNQRALLTAYFNGDGHYRNDGRNVEAGTASQTLAQQLQLIATRCDIRMTPPVKQHSPSAVTAGKRPKYVMQATLLDPKPQTLNNAHIDDEGLWRKITDISTMEYNGNVYNFDVEGDDSYVAADIAVHNCDVERSVCNICKNSATTPDEFCNHVRMKGAMCDYIDPETGHKTSKKSYEDCYGIKFFEISAVFDPADETALIREVRSNVKEASMNKFGPMSEYDKYFGGAGSAQKAKDSMIDQYGEEKGEEVFYATMNKKKNQKNASEGFAPPESVQNNARRGLEMVEAGEAGDGLESATKGRAHDIASGKALSLDHVKRMHSFFERHDKTRPDDGGKGNSPWKTAWMLWGGDSGRSWAESVVGKEVGHDKSEKTSNDKPQITKTRAPEEVDTLREDKVCDICGEIMDGPQCDVCGYEAEPEGFGDPDLSAAKKHDESEEESKESLSTLDVDTNNLPTLSHVTDTGWNTSDVKVAQINRTEKPVLPARRQPASNEPKDRVVKDQKRPDTSSVRTASDFIAVATNQKRNNMETHTADAMTSAPAVAKPDYHTDVEGTGGVGGASNEEASKANAQVNLTDIGGVSGVGTGDEKTVQVDQGDEHSKNIEAIHTDTFGPNDGDSLGQQNPVTDVSSYQVFNSDSFTPIKHHEVPATKSAAWVVSDVRGTEPSDPMGKADDRIDVTDNKGPYAITTQDSGPTATFPDGNSAVTRQADPVDPQNKSFYHDQNSNEFYPTGVDSKDHAFGDGNDSTAHIMSAFKLADTEIELGILDASQKYARVAELEKAAPAIVEASLAYANRVKTAGLKKSARTAKRLPSLVREASTAPATTQAESDDSALFM